MTRLYLNCDLSAKQEIHLSQDHSHYLAKVLRAEVGDKVSVFNERFGEWAACIDKVTKKAVVIRVQDQKSSPRICSPLWLAFAPLKHEAMGFLIEKSTELGVTHLQPVVTDRCNTHRINLERLQKNAVEAAQQCERHDIPSVLNPISLPDFLKDLPDRDWFVALERGCETPLSKSLQGSNWGFLIGPEGGFSEAEVKLLKNTSSLKPISLGPRILRAETAALTVLAIAQGAKEFL